MRHDMAKVVTERPRYGHANASRKWGRRLAKDEYALEDHGPTRVSSARRRQRDHKAFSDLLGPLRGYLRKQVGRPWNAIWAEITQTLDHRSLTGQHIFEHIRSDVEQPARVAADGRVYVIGRWGGETPVRGLYVHPRTGLLCRAKASVGRFRGGPYLQASARLRAFGLPADLAREIYRYRVDGMRLWERRDCGWFIHTYRRVPERIIPGVPRSDGREVRVTIASHLERVATKQASRKEIRDACELLCGDPLVEQPVWATDSLGSQ